LNRVVGRLSARHAPNQRLGRNFAIGHRLNFFATFLVTFFLNSYFWGYFFFYEIMAKVSALPPRNLFPDTVTPVRMLPPIWLPQTRPRSRYLRT
jgi:hypothetical protein